MKIIGFPFIFYRKSQFLIDYNFQSIFSTQKFHDLLFVFFNSLDNREFTKPYFYINSIIHDPLYRSRTYFLDTFCLWARSKKQGVAEKDEGSFGKRKVSFGQFICAACEKYYQAPSLEGFAIEYVIRARCSFQTYQICILTKNQIQNISIAYIFQ